MLKMESIMLLDVGTPIFSRALLCPIRLASLLGGIGLLIAGSIWLPSDDWDLAVCFVMALPTYVLAPWAFRQLFYFRWKWVLLAGVALWGTIDGTYSIYWCLRGFRALSEFRPANFFYCVWLFWICGILWNIDYMRRRFEDRDRIHRSEYDMRRRLVSVKLLHVVVLVALLSSLVAFLCGFFDVYIGWLKDGMITNHSQCGS